MFPESPRVRTREAWTGGEDREMPQYSCQGSTWEFILLGMNLQRIRLSLRTHGLDGRSSAGWERRPRGCSTEGICTAQDGREVPESPSQDLYGSSSVSLPAHVSAAWSCPCWQLLLCPHISSLSVLTDAVPPTVCSAVQTPPGSRALPRGSSEVAGSDGNVRPTLTWLKRCYLCCL